jgi:hypothetical protein
MANGLFQIGIENYIKKFSKCENLDYEMCLELWMIWKH